MKNTCGHDDCFTCPYDDCIMDIGNDPAPAKVVVRKKYQHEWYEKNKDESGGLNCWWCGKKLSGFVPRFKKHNFCDVNCLMCQLYQDNEQKISLYEIK